MGIPKHLVLFIKNLYESGLSVVKIDKMLLASFKVGKGVRQDCKLSLQIFLIYMAYNEYIMREALGWEGGISIGGTKISNLRFADDITFIAANENEMVELIQQIEEISCNYGLEINRAKTKINS